MRALPIILSAILILLVAALAWMGAGTVAAALGTVGGLALGWWTAVATDHMDDREPPETQTAGARDIDVRLIEAIGEPALLLDGSRVAASNSGARALLGQRIDGAPVRLAIRHPAAAALLGGESDGPVEIVGLGDTERRWEMSLRPIDGARKLLRLQDRSYSRAAERMRTNFVANASHELRTPLATLIGFIETLEDEATGADRSLRTRFLGIMAGEARRMRQLIDDLLSLSRIEADRYVAPADAVDLGAVAAQAVSELGAAGDARERIRVIIAQGLPAVAGDAAQLSQLFHNLIGNALKYGRADGAVTVELSDAPSGVRLTVIDEGDGISAEHLPRLTERFYRVDQHRSRAKGGTGLGLAIVKHIVERHRGRLEIASVVGVGTTFTVTFPAAQNGGSTI